ncbi:HPP family protein [Halodesulfovibrio sp.]|jgi:CBS-domain-containing membrane protein|uniref:HPP family protein n=1 Tax=Halodesulfovibrio sp. TaxID=1912772 RepID=UPI0025D547C2|nr:HPP family protein [Halodesulfovibrio sp.]MCT4534668.1 HPP family protein [Halodesulfovibrio sp.]MCT4625519.1 HPP family protein [Halodesulfovibrio sp.]
MQTPKSVQIKMTSFNRQAFSKEIYRPGVISLSRIIWGSIGSALLLGLVALLSGITGVAVLFPPLAATCFINSTCVFLRVARPKSVIVGHFVASYCGLAGVWTGTMLGAGTEFEIPLKLGFAMLYAAIFMQIFDADHPPAAATAAIPAILPLPMSDFLFPLYMAWGGTLTVLFALLWNRVWMEFPAKDIDNTTKCAGLFMDKPQVVGMSICMLSFALMCCKETFETIYVIGLAGMVTGVLVLGTHHFWHLLPIKNLLKLLDKIMKQRVQT